MRCGAFACPIIHTFGITYRKVGKVIARLVLGGGIIAVIKSVAACNEIIGKAFPNTLVKLAVNVNFRGGNIRKICVLATPAACVVSGGYIPFGNFHRIFGPACRRVNIGIALCLKAGVPKGFAAKLYRNVALHYRAHRFGNVRNKGSELYGKNTVFGIFGAKGFCNLACPFIGSFLVHTVNGTGTVGGKNDFIGVSVAAACVYPYGNIAQAAAVNSVGIDNENTVNILIIGMKLIFIPKAAVFGQSNAPKTGLGGYDIPILILPCSIVIFAVHVHRGGNFFAHGVIDRKVADIVHTNARTVCKNRHKGCGNNTQHHYCRKNNCNCSFHKKHSLTCFS